MPQELMVPAESTVRHPINWVDKCTCYASSSSAGDAILITCLFAVLNATAKLWFLQVQYL
jgi:hypothetical protein